MAKHLALSIVAPHGENIARGIKSLEVRSWQPPSLPLRNILIVENERYLNAAGDVDPNGRAVAIVDVSHVEPWLPTEVEAACSSGWQPGFFAWRLENVRPVLRNHRVIAARKLYEVEFPD